MLIRRPEIPSSEITPERLYHGRRDFMRVVAGVAAVAVAWPDSLRAQQASRVAVSGVKRGSLSTVGEELTPFEDASTYTTTTS